MRRILAAVPAAALAGVPAGTARSNDGFGGRTAAGLEFGRTDAVAMEEEDLFISPTRIEVSSVFRNRSGAPVTGEVILPRRRSRRAI